MPICVGAASRRKLEQLGICNALQLKHMDPALAKSNFTVNMEATVRD